MVVRGVPPLSTAAVFTREAPSWLPLSLSTTAWKVMRKVLLVALLSGVTVMVPKSRVRSSPLFTGPVEGVIVGVGTVPAKPVVSTVAEPSTYCRPTGRLSTTCRLGVVPSGRVTSMAKVATSPMVTSLPVVWAAEEASSTLVKRPFAMLKEAADSAA